MLPITHLKARDSLGKYRIRRRLGDGGYATVYEAYDSLEGIPVALKIPHENWLNPETLERFRKEARTQAALDHPNILPLKTADLIANRLVLVYPMGKCSLADRMEQRVSLEQFLDFAEQMISAVAYAHAQSVIHCDIKPENFILFPGPRLRLADFGIARIARQTIEGSGSGTIGYIAPDQALGKLSFRSDVFSLGLICWELLTKRVPEFPFEWPPPGFKTLRRKLHPDFLELLRGAIEPDPRYRFQDAGQLLAAFQRLKPRVRRFASKQRAQRNGTAQTTDWKVIRFRQFAREYRSALDPRAACSHCKGPIGESMGTCPWCGKKIQFKKLETRFPDRCKRCHRGRKLDWRFCAWCFGGGFDEVSTRSYSDRRYTHQCANASCKGPLMPFMRYCPWCRRKTKQNWKLEGSNGRATERCRKCGWGVSSEFWAHCPWCATEVRNGSPKARQR